MARHDAPNYYRPDNIQARKTKAEQDAINNGCPPERASEFENSFQVEALGNGNTIDDALHCAGSLCVKALEKGIPANKANSFQNGKEMDIFLDGYSAGINSVDCLENNITGLNDTYVDTL